MVTVVMFAICFLGPEMFSRGHAWMIRIWKLSSTSNRNVVGIILGFGLGTYSARKSNLPHL